MRCPKTYFIGVSHHFDANFEIFLLCYFFAWAISFAFSNYILDGHLIPLSYELRRRCKQCVLAELKRTQATDWALQKNVTIWWPDLSQNVTNNIPPQISDVGHVFSCLKLISEMNPRLYKLVLILSVLAKSQGTMY